MGPRGILLETGIALLLLGEDANRVGVKIRLEVEHPGDGVMETMAIIDMDRLPRMGELLEMSKGYFQVIQVVHTPFDSEQDAFIILKKRG
jgi:hypothetical protein